MKTARRSFSKEPYVCLKPWPEDCFCQCGGDGVVFTGANDLEKTLTDPTEQTEAIKAVLGEPTKKQHYRTAFFEAFPKDPSCFIRGQGTTVEEAESKAWEKFEKINNCKNHEWDRKNRTDGYCYCTKCPLSGSFLEPLTKCFICQTPTSRYTNKNDVHYCVDHYFELPVDEVVEDSDKPTLGFSKEESTFHHLEDQKLFKLLKQHNKSFSEEHWRKAWDIFIQLRANFSVEFEPLFGPPTKTKQEIHELVMLSLDDVSKIIIKKLKL